MDPIPSREDAAVRTRARRLGLGFAGLLVATFGLIVLGALVRAHEAGLACPDWPLCFGRLVPEFDAKVAFEYAHRVLAGGIALIFAGLGIAVWRTPATRRVCGLSIVVASLLLAVQIVLGGLTVLQLLAAWTVTSHLVTGNLFAVSLLVIALQLLEYSGGGVVRPALPRGLRPALVGLIAVLSLQVVLGGLVSSTFAGMACPEWPTCNGGVWFPSLRGSVGLHLLHRGNGYVLLLAVAGVAWWARRAGRAGRVLALALGLTLAQVIVGILNVLLALPVEITGLHSALAAALILTLGLAARETWLAPVERAQAG